MISATIQKAAETISRLDALRKKMAVAAYLKKKRTAQNNQARIKERRAAELLIERALQPFFVDQIESAAKALAETVVAPDGTKVFCPTGPGGGVDATCKPGGKSAAVPKVEIPDKIKDRIKEKGLLNVATFDEQRAYLADHGVKKEAVDQMHRLFDRHKWGGDDQAVADKEISDEIHKDTDLGKALRVQIAFETEAIKFADSVRGDQADDYEKQSKRDMKEAWEYGWGPKNSDAYDSWEHQWNTEEKYIVDKMRKPITFYRKGDADKDVLPTSLNASGAQSHSVTGSAQPKFDPDHNWTADDLFKQGYMVLGGAVYNQMGYSGEAEVTWIKVKASSKSFEFDSIKSTQQTLPIVFNPSDWNQKLVDTLYPAMVKIAVVGMDGEMRRMGLQIKRGVKETKSTATELLAGLDDSGGLLDIDSLETPYGVVNMAFLFEYPDWMKQAITEFLNESFSQPYWEDLNKTTLGDIEKYLQEGLKDGWSIERMATEMAPQLLETGRYAKIRGRNIARTEAGHALNGARSMGIDSVIAEMAGTGLDIQKLWHSVRGTTTRDTHRAIHGVPADQDGMWTLSGYKCRWPSDTSLPPQERCSCFPGFVNVSGSFVGVQRAWYEGTIAEIITVAGARLSVTPNHPILTPDGFVDAGKMKPGDELIAYRFDEQGKVLSNGAGSSNEVQNKPAQIEKVFEAFSAAAVEVEIIHSQPDHFYGDGESIKGDIEIVRADWELLDGSESSSFHKEGNFIFKGVNIGLSSELCVSSSHLASRGSGGTSLLFPSLTQPGNGVSFGCISPSRALAIGAASDFNPGFKKSSSKNTARDVDSFRESLQRDSRVVLIDEVLEILYQSFSGHVYDLESEYGVVVASDSVTPNIGIATSNCQCTLETAFGMSDSEARELIQAYEGKLAKASWATLRTKVFCPTGPGGGVDATCKPGGAAKIPAIPPLAGAAGAALGPKYKALYDAASTGDTAAVLAVKTNPDAASPYPKKLHEYKMAVLKAMEDGKDLGPAPPSPLVPSIDMKKVDGSSPPVAAALKEGDIEKAVSIAKTEDTNVIKQAAEQIEAPPKPTTEGDLADKAAANLKKADKKKVLKAIAAVEDLDTFIPLAPVPPGKEKELKASWDEHMKEHKEQSKIRGGSSPYFKRKDVISGKMSLDDFAALSEKSATAYSREKVAEKKLVHVSNLKHAANPELYEKLAKPLVDEFERLSSLELEVYKEAIKTVRPVFFKEYGETDMHGMDMDDLRHVKMKGTESTDEAYTSFMSKKADRYTGLTAKTVNTLRDINTRKEKINKELAGNGDTPVANAYYGEPAVARDLPSQGMGPAKVPVKTQVGDGSPVDKFGGFLGQAEIYIQTRAQAVDKILSSGVMKNGFQGGTKSIGLGKSGYKATRKEIENKIFGLDENTPVSDRPIYGYLEHPDKSRSQGSSVGGNYGSVQLVLHSTMKERTSFTLGDSLDDSQIHGRLAGSVSNPPSVDKVRDTKMKMNTKGKGNTADDHTVEYPHMPGTEMNLSYVEAQIHGGVALKDIKEVRIEKGISLSSKSLANLQKEGIVVREIPPKMRYYIGHSEEKLDYSGIESDKEFWEQLKK